MEVKDLTYTASGLAVSGKQTSSKALPRVTVTNGPGSVSRDASNSSTNKAEAALSQADALVSDISNQAKSINSYVKSLNGILDQGVKESSEVRRQALSKEANQILQAIKDKVVSLKVNKLNNVAADPLRSEVEAKIGRTLELLFPEDSEGQSSMPDLSFSNKDLIISVQTKILRTTQYLDSLRESEPKKSVEVKEILDKAETAQLNVESSQASVRDLDKAFKLAQEASSSIGKDKETALSAIGDVREHVDVEG